MTAEKALKRTERAERKRQKQAEDKAIKDIKRRIKDACDMCWTNYTVWIDKRYIQNIKAYFDKRGYKTEIQMHEGHRDVEFYIRWGREK